MREKTAISRAEKLANVELVVWADAGYARAMKAAIRRTIRSMG
jgi:hypothetical protein